MFEECRLRDTPGSKFILSSGKTSPYFYDFDLLGTVETVGYAERLLDIIPEEILDEIDFIATPVVGGIELAFVIARLLDDVPRVKVLTAVGTTRGPKFSGKKYLIVDDVLSTGQAVEKVRKILSDNICVGVATFIFRGKRLPTGLPCFYLEHKEREE
jgi:orotate phosphoribosyltransferase